MHMQTLAIFFPKLVQQTWHIVGVRQKVYEIQK